MRNRLFPVLLFVCFILLPLLFLERDRREALEIEQELVLRELGAAGELILDQAARTGSYEAQIRNRILEFKQHLASVLPTRDALDLYWRKRLRSLLPPHELVLFKLEGKEPRLLFHAGLPLGLASSAFTAAFSRAVNGPQPPEEKLLKPCLMAFAPLFGFTPHPNGLFTTWKGNLETGHDRSRTCGFLWDEARLAGGGRGLFLASFLIDPNDRSFPFRSMATGWKNPGRGIAFLDAASGNIEASSGIQRSRFLMALLREAVVDRRRLLPAQRLGPGLLQAGKTIPGTTWKPVVFTRIPTIDRESPFRRAVRQTGMGLTLVIAFFLMVEGSWFGRGRRLPLAAALLGMFLLIALLPISGAGTITRRTLAEQSQAAKDTLAAQAHDELQRIDLDARFEWARTASAMKRFSSHPAVLLQLRLLERERKAAGRRWRDPGDLPKRMQEAAKQDLLRRFGLSGSAYAFSPGRFIAFFGADGFRTAWSQLMEAQGFAPDSPAAQMATDLLKILGSLFIERVEQARKTVQAVSPQYSIILELAFDSLVAVGGLETILNVRHFPHQVSFFTTAIERLGLQQVPLLVNGSLSYLCIWFWTQLEVNRAYLNGLLQKQPSPQPGALDERVFATLGQGRSRTESIPTSMETNAGLRELMERAELAGEAVRSSIPDPDDPARSIGIQEALPARAMGNFVLGTQRSTQAIAAAEEERRAMTRAGMLIALLLAILVAFAGARHVLAPIRRLQAGVEEIAADRYAERLEIDREDEFGSLFQAFNTMARGLQEGRLLDRYVSSSVRRALTDATFSEAAAAGEIREVTILFSSLASFWETAAGRPPGEVFPYLEKHLQAMDRAVTQFGGEIDKVIGEKILVVFDHQFLGGSEMAAVAAIEVVRQIRRELASELPASLQPVMGINSGPVIAGMLGATTVRLDYTVIGDPVNLAARLATLSSGLIMADPGFSGVLLSGRVVAMLGGKVPTRRLPIKQVKGKTQEVEVFTLLEQDKQHD